MSANLSIRQATKDLKDLCECPVCLSDYTDPRLLKCGHQFCQKCLESICDQIGKSILCPTCRITTYPDNGDVTNLPKSTLYNYMQDLILQLPSAKSLGNTCTKCGEHEPTRHCPECKPELAFMCDGCFEAHQTLPRLAKHETVEFNPLLVCAEHPSRMVECFCHECQRPVCDECIFETHKSHRDKVQDITEAAEKSRETLRKYLSNLEDATLHEDSLQSTERLIQTLSDKKRAIAKSKVTIKESLKVLGNSIDLLFCEIETSLDNQTVDVKTKHENLTEVLNAQQKMKSFAKTLLGDVSDPQVIMGARDLPELDTDIKEVTIEVPDMEEVLDKMSNDLTIMNKNLAIKSKTKSVKVPKIGHLQNWDLQKTTEIRGQSWVMGITFDSEQHEIVARYKTDEEPIRRYSLDGKEIAAFGKQQKSIKTNIYTQLCIDYRRQLYLIPCTDGTFIRMTRDGQVKVTKQIGSKLWAVDHLTDEDLYVVSGQNDKEQSQVLLITHDDLSVVSTVTDKVSVPQFLCVGKIDGNSVIVISDHEHNKIHIYTPGGELIRSYESGPLGKLSNPGAVSMDSLGRIYVCDKDNYRVLRIYTDKDGDHWECILNKEQLGGERPVLVMVTDDLCMMAVNMYTNNDVILYRY